MKKFFTYLLWFFVVTILVFLTFYMIFDSLEILGLINKQSKKEDLTENKISRDIIKSQNNSIDISNLNSVILNENKNKKNKIEDWRLVLVNFENALPEDFEVNLSNIDKTRQFDSRAIEYLNQMLQGLKDDGIRSVWVQSAYRSPEYQSELYNEKVEEVMSYNVTKQEAEEYTSKLINKPGTSEHNLGLAVDFNYVDEDFDKTEGFEWLTKNAEDYGFILRYKEEKQEITKVTYEPWHWRFVGVEHAKKINELNMCLEEYIKYLENN